MSEPIKTMYLLHPGHVRAKDGDIHYISASQLQRLYNVHPRMCETYTEYWDRAYSEDFKKQYVHLYPRGDGDYSLTAPNHELNNKEEV